MFKKFLLKMRFLNIWSWAQISVVVFTLVCFFVLSVFSFSFIIERQAKIEVEKVFENHKTFMQENTKRLLEAARNIAEIAETGNSLQLEKISTNSTVQLIGNSKLDFDLLMVLDKEGKQLYCSKDCDLSEAEMQIPAIQKAMSGQEAISIERIPASILKEQGLEQKAKIMIKDGSGKILTDALARVAAVPVFKKDKIQAVVVIVLLLNNNNYMPDWYGNNVGALSSVFMDGYRVSTNLMDANNKRKTGYKMPEEAYNNVFVKGIPYTGKVDLGELTYAKYDVLYNADQKPVGAVGIAINYSRFLPLFERALIIIWGLAVILGIIMLLGLRRLNALVMNPIKQVTEGAIQLAHNDLGYRVPLENTAKCWELLTCKKIDCPMYGKDEVACWLVEGTLCSGTPCSFQDKMLYCETCSVFLNFTRNETRQLAVTFNYMAGVIQDQTKQLKERQRKLYELIEELGDYESMVLTLALTVEAKDPYTLGHSERVSKYALALGKQLHLTPSDLETLRIGTILHDIGKIAIGDEILRKPATLTQSEFKLVQEHPIRGVGICGNLKFANNSLSIIRHHHERYDGKGYPDKIKGNEIPLIVRITTIADAFDAMTSDRPYRPGMDIYKAIAELKANAGKQFDPVLVEEFIELIQNNKIKIVNNKEYNRKQV